MKISFLGHRGLSEVVAYKSGVPITASEFLADACSLADRLPASAFVVNLCRSRYLFAVGFAATMLRDQISLLPAVQVRGALRELRQSYGDFCLLVDDDEVREFKSVRVTRIADAGSFTLDDLSFSEDATSAIVFTSGSTGTPVPNRKNWGDLARGGIAEARRFRLDRKDPTVIVGTVPPQHMYGLETTVVMTFQAGLVMHDARPLLPADIRVALSDVDAQRILVTTPVHMRALLASGIDLPELKLAVSATAPLSLPLAKSFEARFNVEVHEVYGFTEAGMVATRRTADGDQWHTLSGVTIREDGDTFVSGGHVPEEVAFSDIVEVVDGEHFILQGRSTDVVNVAGKRASIAHLDQTLCELEGVVDGAFLMPGEDTERVTRFTAFAVAPGMTRKHILEELSQCIDPAFLPRPLYLVDSLPRNTVGKIARQSLVELAIHCARHATKKPVFVNRVIDTAHPSLSGHFPGDPIVPGVVLLDEVAEAIVTELDYAVDTIWGLRSAKFLRPVRPGDQLSIQLTTDGDDGVRFEIGVKGETAATGALERKQDSD